MSIQKTEKIKWMIGVRIVAGGPLLLFGIMHLTSMPMGPLLEAAGLPAFLAVPASLGEVVAGLSLLGGVYSRVGAAIAIGAMLGAVFTHIQIPSDGWPEANGGPQEPPLMYLAIVIIVLAGVVIWKGAGAMSFDGRSSGGDADAGSAS